MVEKNKGQENLKPVRTTEEAQAWGKRGGIASVKSKKRKKNLAECAKILLELELKDKKAIAKMQSMGIDDEDVTNAMLMSVSILNEANKGNVQAYKALSDQMEKAEGENNKKDGILPELINYLKGDSNTNE